MSKEKRFIECVLCHKKYEAQTYYAGLKHGGEIVEWSKVCVHCHKLYEIGKKREKATKADGKLGHAAVKLAIKTDGKDGDPKGDTTIRSGDIVAAMGGVKLKGTSLNHRFGRPEGAIPVGKAGNWDWGASELIQVPEARAKAMDKILAAFHSALAKTRLEGFEEGRSLLAGLASGTLRLGDYDDTDKAARMQKGYRERRG